MTYGIQIYNSSGYVQVDDGYTNYALVQSGVGTSNSKINTVDLGSPLDSVVFVKLPVGKWFSGVVMDSDGFWTTGDPSAGGYSFEYRVYRRNDQVVNIDSQYGFRVFKGNGTTVFDSLRNYARLKSASIIPSTAALPLVIPGIGVNPWIYAAAFGIHKMENAGGYSLRTYSIRATVQSDFSIRLSSEFSTTAGQLYNSPLYLSNPRQVLLSI